MTNRNEGADLPVGREESLPEGTKEVTSLPLEIYKNNTPEARRLAQLIRSVDEINRLGKLPKPPRYYQFNALEAMFEAVAKNKHRGYIELPTGTGKTKLILYFLSCYQSQMSIIAAPSQEIIDQFKTDIDSILPNHRVITLSSAEEVSALPDRISRSQPTLVLISHAALRLHREILSQKLAGWNESAPLKIPVIVDEAHQFLGHESAATIQSLSTPVIGATATPEYEYVRDKDKERGSSKVVGRQSDKPTMNEVFGERLYAYSLLESVEAGFTPPFRVLGLNVGYESASDLPYNLKPAQVNKLLLTATASALITEQLPEKKVIVVVSSVKEAKAFQMWQKVKEPNRVIEVLSGAMSSEERAQALQNIADSKNGVLIGVDIVKTGLDLPNVDAVIMAKAATSALETRQALGRGLRPYLADNSSKNQDAEEENAQEENATPEKLLFILKAAHTQGTIEELTQTALGIPIQKRNGSQPRAGEELTTESQPPVPPPIIESSIVATASVGDRKIEVPLGLKATLKELLHVTPEFVRNQTPSSQDIDAGISAQDVSRQVIAVLTRDKPSLATNKARTLGAVAAVALNLIQITDLPAWQVTRTESGYWQLHISKEMLPHATQIMTDMVRIGHDDRFISQRTARRRLSSGSRNRWLTIGADEELKNLDRFTAINSQGQICHLVLASDVSVLQEKYFQLRNEKVQLKGISEYELENREGFPIYTFQMWVKMIYPDFKYSPQSMYSLDWVDQFLNELSAASSPPLSGEYFSLKQLQNMSKQQVFWRYHNFVNWARKHAQTGEMWIVPPPFSGAVGGWTSKPFVRFHQTLLDRYLNEQFPDLEQRHVIAQELVNLPTIPAGWVSLKSLQQSLNIYKDNILPFIEEFRGKLEGIDPPKTFRGKVHPALCVTKSTVAMYLEYQLITNLRPGRRTENPWREYLPDEFKQVGSLRAKLRDLGVTLPVKAAK